MDTREQLKVLHEGDVIQYITNADGNFKANYATVKRVTPERNINVPNILIHDPRFGLFWRHERNLIKLSSEQALLWKLENA